jgi:hypothetical protein
MSVTEMVRLVPEREAQKVQARSFLLQTPKQRGELPPATPSATSSGLFQDWIPWVKSEFPIRRTRITWSLLKRQRELQPALCFRARKRAGGAREPWHRARHWPRISKSGRGNDSRPPDAAVWQPDVWSRRHKPSRPVRPRRVRTDIDREQFESSPERNRQRLRKLRDVTMKSQVTSPVKPDREAVVEDLQRLTPAQVQHLKTVYAIVEVKALDRTLRTGLSSN